ncbi:MAG: hypothetical protein ACRYGL_00585 [Janthinobacterium lividum]
MSIDASALACRVCLRGLPDAPRNAASSLSRCGRNATMALWAVSGNRFQSRFSTRVR